VVFRWLLDKLWFFKNSLDQKGFSTLDKNGVLKTWISKGTKIICLKRATFRICILEGFYNALNRQRFKIATKDLLLMLLPYKTYYLL